MPLETGAGVGKSVENGPFPFTEVEVFGDVPEGNVDAETMESFDWLHATLQPHQVEGVNWLLHAYRNGINGILADESKPCTHVHTASMHDFNVPQANRALVRLAIDESACLPSPGAA